MELSAKEFAVATGLSPYLSCDKKVYTSEELAEFNKYIEDVESKQIEFIQKNKDVAFGREFREKFYTLDPNVHYLNHGKKKSSKKYELSKRIIRRDS